MVNIDVMTDKDIIVLSRHLSLMDISSGHILRERGVSRVSCRTQNKEGRQGGVGKDYIWVCGHIHNK